MNRWLKSSVLALVLAVPSLALATPKAAAPHCHCPPCPSCPWGMAHHTAHPSTPATKTQAHPAQPKK